MTEPTKENAPDEEMHDPIYPFEEWGEEPDDLLRSVKMCANQAAVEAAHSESLEESNARFLFGVLREACDEIIRLREESARRQAELDTLRAAARGVASMLRDDADCAEPERLRDIMREHAGYLDEAIGEGK